MYPVSYTHLNYINASFIFINANCIYKNEACVYSLQQTERKFAVRPEKICKGGKEDVYKRQILSEDRHYTNKRVTLS